ncbi:hypothetical protein RchiOBHm_Chr1g0380321 [Rosa chinensis]|uniref:Uncharacterized protein n=1 Tax=Rosa chinensis TaxID=74649 RepID=A0A2P6SNY3_ROSCH|nr:hypothetical protein RchiOBHm_Chr1g0380321 [Rosa chinensis]
MEIFLVLPSRHTSNSPTATGPQVRKAYLSFSILHFVFRSV